MSTSTLNVSKPALLSLLLLTCASPAMAEILHPGQFSMVVRDNANLGSGVRVNGGGFFGGELSYQGANGSFGGGLSAGETSLYANGGINANQRIDLMGKDYYIEGGSPVPLQNAGNGATAAENGDTFFNAFDSASDNMAGLDDNGVTVDSSDYNQVRFNLTPGQLNVINLDKNNAAFLSSQNANVMFNNFTEDTFLVVNYTLDGDMNYRAKNQNLPQYAYDNIVWNFVGNSTLTIDQSVSTFKGSIFATNSHIEWYANDLDGQLVSDSVSWSQTRQVNYYDPWSNIQAFELDAPADAVEPGFDDVNAPLSVFGVACMVFGVFLHIRRKRT